MVSRRISKRMGSYEGDTVSRTCVICETDRPITDYYIFHKPNGHPNRAATCRFCQVARALAKRAERYTREERLDAQHRYNQNRGGSVAWKRLALRHRYGMEVADHGELLDSQAGRCAICDIELDLSAPRTAPNRINIDHCHDTLMVRGMLCGACNRGLGCFTDDPARMARAIAYVEAGGVPLAVERKWKPLPPRYARTAPPNET